MVLNHFKRQMIKEYNREFMESPIWNTILEILYYELIHTEMLYGIQFFGFRKILPQESLLNIEHQGYEKDLIKELIGMIKK